MQLTIDLHLKTREVYKLFELRISDKRFFIDAVLRKINRIDLVAPEMQRQVEQDSRSLITEFTQKTAILEKILDKNKIFKTKPINGSSTLLNECNDLILAHLEAWLKWRGPHHYYWGWSILL